jgi:hypothetical protein
MPIEGVDLKSQGFNSAQDLREKGEIYVLILL